MGGGSTLNVIGYTPACTKSFEKGLISTYKGIKVFTKKGYIMIAPKGIKMAHVKLC